MTSTQRLRLLTWVSLALYMVLSPLLRQGLGINRPYLNKWTMFSEYGKGVCDVRYEQRLADGSSEVVDRFEALDDAPWTQADEDLRRVEDLGRAKRIGRRICRKLDGEAPDLRLFATCGTSTAWVPGEQGETNLCEQKRKGRKR